MKHLAVNRRRLMKQFSRKNRVPIFCPTSPVCRGWPVQLDRFDYQQRSNGIFVVRGVLHFSFVGFWRLLDISVPFLTRLNQCKRMNFKMLMATFVVFHYRYLVRNSEQTRMTEHNLARLFFFFFAL